MPLSCSEKEKRQLRFLRALLAAEEYEFDVALDLLEALLRVEPPNAGRWHFAAHAAIGAFRVDDAKRSLGSYAAVARGVTVLRGGSPRLSQSHYGQLLDEWIVDPDAFSALSQALRSLQQGSLRSSLPFSVRGNPRRRVACSGSRFCTRSAVIMSMRGAVSGHAIVGAAPEAAVNAINDGGSDAPWLSTGPGLITRAAAQAVVGTGAEGDQGRASGLTDRAVHAEQLCGHRCNSVSPSRSPRFA